MVSKVGNMSFFNPFSHLSINKHYPLAKVRRSTLGERFKDTFEVFNGAIELEELYHQDEYSTARYPKSSHVGIVDYLLVVPAFIAWLQGEPDTIQLFSFIRVPIAFILTLIVSLFVFGAHLASLAVNSYKDKQVEGLEITENDNKKNIHKLSDDLKKDAFICEEVVLSAKANDGLAVCYYNLFASEWEVECTRHARHTIFVTEENKPIIRWILESNYANIIKNSSARDFENIANAVDKSTEPKFI